MKVSSKHSSPEAQNEFRNQEVSPSSPLSWCFFHDYPPLACSAVRFLPQSNTFTVPSSLSTAYQSRRRRYDPVSSTELFFNDIPDEMLRYERDSKVPLAVRDAVR